MLVLLQSIRTSALKRNGLLDETCPLEMASQERFDAYGFGKLKQEEIVKDYSRKYKLPHFCESFGRELYSGQASETLAAGSGLVNLDFSYKLTARSFCH